MRRLIAGLAAVAGLAAGCSGGLTRADLTDSVFRVRGEGCRVATIGTAFAVEPDVVLANAHVVAGVTSQLTVTSAAGIEHQARLLAFDPDRDLALLLVPDLEATPLRLGAPTVTDAVLIDAHAEGDLQVIEASVVRVIDISSGDIYDEGEVLREGLELEADIEPGTSGAPVIADGAVIGAVFAETRDGGTVFATAPSELRQFLDLPTGEIPLPAGRCR